MCQTYQGSQNSGGGMGFGGGGGGFDMAQFNNALSRGFDTYGQQMQQGFNNLGNSFGQSFGNFSDSFGNGLSMFANMIGNSSMPQGVGIYGGMPLMPTGQPMPVSRLPQSPVAPQAPTQPAAPSNWQAPPNLSGPMTRENMQAVYQNVYGRAMPESDVAAWQATGGNLQNYFDALTSTPEFADRYHQVRRSMAPDDPRLNPVA